MDDLTIIKGIGKATAEKLAEAGIDSFARLALGRDDPIAAEELGIKDEWIDQAAELAKQDNPEGSSGTARKAPSTGSGTTTPDPAQNPEQAPSVGAQPGSPTNLGGAGNPAGPAQALRDREEAPAPAAPPPDAEAEALAAAVEFGTAGPPGRAAWLLMQELDEQEALRRYPRVAAALRAWADNAGTQAAIAAGPTLRITASRGGFRRCWVAHPKAATDYPVERFTPDELERLLAEPMLTVELM